VTAKQRKQSVKPEESTEKYGTVVGPGEVRFERILPGPIERLWAYLTEPEKRAKWFAIGPMELRPAGKVEFVFYNSKLSHQKEPVPEKYQKFEGYTTTGEVTRCEPPRLLSFLWQQEQGVETEVTFELSSRGKEVLLVLTHRKLAARAGMINVSGGWHVHLAILADILNGVDPRHFWPAFAKLEVDYEKRIPKDVVVNSHD
jgi:uncharacterized protein YndB with AHSA1/START domain